VYCNQCGNENKSSNNYCHSCGIKINLYNVPNVAFVKKQSDFCNQCGVRLVGQYCSECGRPVDIYSISNKKISLDMETVKSNTQNLITKDGFLAERIKNFFLEDKKVWIESLIGAGIAFIVGLVICFMLDLVFLRGIKEGINEIYNQTNTVESSIKMRLKPNAIDILQASMQTPFKISFRGNLGGTNNNILISFRFAFLLFLLIPGSSFLAGNFRKYKEGSSTIDGLGYYIRTSLIFSIVLNVFSLLNYKLISGANKFIIDFSFKFHGGFAFFRGLLGTFMIAFLIQLIWSLIIKKESISNIYKEMPFSDSIGSFVWIIKWQFIYSGILVLVLYILSVIGILGSEMANTMRNIKALLFIPSLWGYGALAVLGNGFRVQIGQAFIKLGLFRVAAEGVLPGSVDKSYAFTGLNVLVVLGTIVILYLGFKRIKDKKNWKDFGVLGILLAVWNVTLAITTQSYINIRGNLDTVGEALSILGLDIPVYLQEKMWVGYSPVFVFINIFVWILLFGILKYFGGEKIKLDVLEEKLMKYRTWCLAGGGILVSVMMVVGFKVVSPQPKNVKTNENRANVKAVSLLGKDNSSQINDTFNINNIETVLLGNNNTYFIKTHNSIYRYEPRKNKIKPIYQTNGEIVFLNISKDNEKLALYDESYDGDKVIIINDKGKELNKKPFNDLYNLQWNSKGSALILEGVTHQMMFPKRSDNEMLEIGGNNLIWTGDDKIAFLEDEKVYEYDYKSKVKKDMELEANSLWNGGAKVLAIKNENREIENEDGSITSEYITFLESMDHTISEESINETIMQYLVDDNNQKYIIKHDKEGDNILEILRKDETIALENEVSYISDISEKDGKLIVRRMDTLDYFMYDAKSNEWENITMNLIYTLEQMKEGAN